MRSEERGTGRGLGFRTAAWEKRKAGGRRMRPPAGFWSTCARARALVSSGRGSWKCTGLLYPQAECKSLWRWTKREILEAEESRRRSFKAHGKSKGAFSVQKVLFGQKKRFGKHLIRRSSIFSE